MAAPGSSRSPIVISDDDEPKQGPPAEGSGCNATPRRPEWLPDCFVVGVERRCGDGTVILDYTCPAGFTFNSRFEVEEYCSSGALQRAIDAQATLQDMTTLQGKYQWLRGYPGFVLEIRAGGDSFSKLFKFYARPHDGLRFATKADFMRFIHHGKEPDHTNEECDIRSEDNIIAQLEFNIHGLPPGWVKETAFRKCRDGIRRDLFFTDPITKKVYRSLKAAVKSFRSGTDAESHDPKLSVIDMYFFDNCTNMLPFLAKRLKIEGTKDHECNESGQDSSPGCYTRPLVSLYSVKCVVGPCPNLKGGKGWEEVHLQCHYEERRRAYLGRGE